MKKLKRTLVLTANGKTPFYLQFPTVETIRPRDVHIYSNTARNGRIQRAYRGPDSTLQGNSYVLDIFVVGSQFSQLLSSQLVVFK